MGVYTQKSFHKFFLTEEPKETTASKQAKQKGLKHIGYGIYADKTGNAVAKSKKKGSDVVLEPIKKDKKPKPGRPFAGKKVKPKQSRIGKTPPKSFISDRDLKRVEDNLAKTNGPEIANEFTQDLNLALGAAQAGKKAIVDRFISKWKISAENRAGGIRLYSHAKDKKGNYIGDRKPFGKGTINGIVAGLFSKHTSLPSRSQVTGSKEAPPRELFTHEVHPPTVSDPKARIVRGVNQEVLQVTFGKTTLKYLNKNQYPGKSEEVYQMIDLINSQVQALGRLFDAQGKIKGAVFDSGPQSVNRAKDNLNNALRSIQGVDKDRVVKLTQTIDKMSTLTGSEQEIITKFNELEKALLTEIDSKEDKITAGRAYIAESLSVLRETLLGGMVIVSSASDFPVGDIVSLRSKTNLPGIISVTIDFQSVKFGEGAESSQKAKIELTVYKSSQYGSGQEIKKLLSDLVSYEKGSIYHDAFYGNIESADKRINQLYEKFGKLLKDYYGISDLKVLKQELQKGKPVTIDKKTGEISSKMPIAILKKGHKLNIECADKVEAWKRYNELSFIVDAINNTHMFRQGFRNQNHTRQKGIVEGTGGFEYNGKHIIGISVARPDKMYRNCLPGVKFASAIVNMSVDEIPARV